MNRKGFTLIELLVVIAIIGILSSVAIIYLGDARKKAYDSKIQSNVTTASTQLELDRANGDIIDETKVSSTIAKLGEHPCNGSWSKSNDGNYDNVAFYSALCTDNTKIFCADSQGFRGVVSESSIASGKCQ